MAEGGLTEAAKSLPASLNITGLGALDLRTLKPKGKPWDVTNKSDRRLARRTQDEDCPDWIIGSPPCTDMCTLNVGTNFSRMHPDEVSRRTAAAQAHIKFTCKMYRRQISRGRFFSMSTQDHHNLGRWTVYASLSPGRMFTWINATNAHMV